VELFPTELEGRRVICLRDPAGLTDQLAFLPPPAVIILSLCDGEHDAAEVARAATQRLRTKVEPDDVTALIDRLDEALFLDTPRFRAHEQRLLDEFRAQPLRAATHAGQSYPDAPGELAALLDGHLVAARARAGAPRADAPPVGLVAPHIDFHRGAAIYGDAYAQLVDAKLDALDLIVVLGTDHVGVRQPFSLTRKSYDTPLGATHTDAALVDGLARALGDDVFEEEFHHRQEHSIEFQAVWLKHVLGERTPPILPVLCGPLGECTPGRAPAADARVQAFVRALHELVGDRRTLVVAGADLAHVGPRFGDDPVGVAGRAEVEAADRRALGAVDAGDAEAFWREVAAVEDRFRVCGISPIYAALALLGDRPRRGELLGYTHCPADDGAPDGDPPGPTSWVTVAASVLR
jgi:hypothetical protein